MQKEELRAFEDIEFDLHKLSSVLWIALDSSSVEEDEKLLFGLARDIIDRARNDLLLHDKAARAAVKA